MAKDMKIESFTMRLSEAEAKNIADGITLNAQISGLNDQRTADAILIDDLRAQIDVLTDRAVGSIGGLVALD
jgi:hypothetical protein